ncbi:MAG: hypothetical protein WBG37_22050 [Desulfobacterales bacterium]
MSPRKIHSQIFQPGGGGFVSKYKSLSVGDQNWARFIYFEIVTTLFRNIPGALGLALRALAYRPLFRSLGKGVLFGSGISIRNPGNISIGNQVVIDDNCVLDAKGDPPGGIEIGDRVFVSRNVLMGCKNGAIRLGHDISIGPNTIIHAVEESQVTVGPHSVIAANCYLIGGPDYRHEQRDLPMMAQGFQPGRGIRIAGDVWLGAAVLVADGAEIETGAIIGANSLVKGAIPPYAIAMGSPATVKKFREGETP